MYHVTPIRSNRGEGMQMANYALWYVAIVIYSNYPAAICIHMLAAAASQPSHPKQCPTHPTVQINCWTWSGSACWQPYKSCFSVAASIPTSNGLRKPVRALQALQRPSKLNYGEDGSKFGATPITLWRMWTFAFGHCKWLLDGSLTCQTNHHAIHDTAPYFFS